MMAEPEQRRSAGGFVVIVLALLVFLAFVIWNPDALPFSL
jgi:Tfp pilus assembly protein PilX